MNLAPESAPVSQPQAGAFLHRLMAGDFGLAKTYWLYGVVASLGLRVAMFGYGFMLGLLFGDTRFTVVMILLGALAMDAYLVAVMVGVWRAAGRYTGAKIWAVLAQIVSVLAIIALALEVIDILKML